MLGILLACHIVVCVALIGVVLLQRSEGGALGMGGGPTGFMTARGAGDPSDPDDLDPGHAVLRAEPDPDPAFGP